MTVAYFHSDETVIAAAPQQVYELLLAVRRYGEWWTRIRSTVLGPEGVLRVGSRFQCSGGRLRWVVEVTGLEPYRRIDLAYAAGDLLGPVRWELSPADRGTRLAYVYRGVRPNSPHAEKEFASGRNLRLHAQLMRDDAYAGLRRVLEAPAADVSGADLFTALHTQRAVRHFRPEPIADAILEEIFAAATRAPSARNAQPWGFVAVRDAARRTQIAQRYLDAWRQAQRYIARVDADADIKARPDYAPMMRAVDHLGTHLASAPVLVLCGLDTTRLGRSGDGRGGVLAPQPAYASIFPAVQNLMLAARGLGIGSTLTTLTSAVEAEVRALVGMPDHVHLAALVPLGYPTRPFRVTRRRPLEDVVFGERWGIPLSKPSAPAL
jgi:nitroreductase/uncharacterized protein YndB with AHSA1/START domain